jgi:hypothetical protein
MSDNMPAMASRRNPHAAAAEDLLEYAHGAPGDYAPYLVTKAHGEALLAIAYEQRTANIIAWQALARDGALADVIKTRLAIE